MLADYTIALLRHDKDTAELKALCLSQLADFLQQGMSLFTKSDYHLRPLDLLKSGLISFRPISFSRDGTVCAIVIRCP